MSVHEEAVGSVMHPLSTMTSVLRAGRAAMVAVITGMEDDVMYAAVQAEDVGSVIHDDIESTSLLRDVAVP